MKGISTRHLKWLTTFLIVLPIGMMFYGPWLLRPPHRIQPRIFVQRVGAYGFILAASVIGAGLGAYAILRREQEAYRQNSLQNIHDLIESTRQDQRK